jgi:translation elongation factor EF-G
MVAVERRQLNARKPLTIEQIQARRTAVQPLTTATVHFGDPIETVDESWSNDGYLLLGFARVLAGVIHAGDRLFVRSTRTIDAQSVVIDRLYVFMGRELHAVDEVSECWKLEQISIKKCI